MGRVLVDKHERQVPAAEQKSAMVSQGRKEPPPGEVVVVIALVLTQVESGGLEPRKGFLRNRAFGRRTAGSNSWTLRTSAREKW